MALYQNISVLPIKRWRHCSFLTPLGSTRRTSRVPRSKINFGNGMFAVAGPALWNRLPATIRSSDTLQNFKNQLKAHFFWCTNLFFFSIHIQRGRPWIGLRAGSSMRLVRPDTTKIYKVGPPWAQKLFSRHVNVCLEMSLFAPNCNYLFWHVTLVCQNYRKCL